MGLVDGLLASFQQAQIQANAANEARYQQGMELFDKVIAQFQEGGASTQALEAALATGERRSTAQGMQSLVSSGLSGTTTAATLGRQFQEEVGVPARLQAESQRTRDYAAALGQKAGFIERREDVGPSYSDIASLAQSYGRGRAASSRAYIPSSGPATPAFPKAPSQPFVSTPARPAYSINYGAQKKATTTAKPRLDIKFAAPVSTSFYGAATSANQRAAKAIQEQYNMYR